MKKTSLLYHTFDGDLKKVSVTPRCLQSRCSFQMDVLAGGDDGGKKTIIIEFDEVAALEFSMNFCDNMIGADLGGFYKVPGRKQKRKLLERNFKRRRKDWLMTRMSDKGAYEYDEDDPADILNYHDEVDKLEEQLKKYNLFLLQSMGGAWLILAKNYECVELDQEEATTREAAQEMADQPVIGE